MVLDKRCSWVFSVICNQTLLTECPGQKVVLGSLNLRQRHHRDREPSTVSDLFTSQEATSLPDGAAEYGSSWNAKPGWLFQHLLAIFVFTSRILNLFLHGPHMPFSSLTVCPISDTGAKTKERREVNLGPAHCVETAQLVLAPPKRQEIPSGNTD